MQPPVTKPKSRVGAQRAAIGSTIGPPTTIFLAALFLHERLSAWQLLGSTTPASRFASERHASGQSRSPSSGSSRPQPTATSARSDSSTSGLSRPRSIASQCPEA
jgi:hypothetical protein